MYSCINSSFRLYQDWKNYWSHPTTLHKNNQPSPQDPVVDLKGWDCKEFKWTTYSKMNPCVTSAWAPTVSDAPLPYPIILEVWSCQELSRAAMGFSGFLAGAHRITIMCDFVKQRSRQIISKINYQISLKINIVSDEHLPKFFVKAQERLDNPAGTLSGRKVK